MATLKFGDFWDWTGGIMSKKTERYKVKRGSISVKLSPWPKIWEHMIKADPWSLPLPPSLTFHTCKSNIHILSCLKKCTTHKKSNVQRYLKKYKVKKTIYVSQALSLAEDRGTNDKSNSHIGTIQSPPPYTFHTCYFDIRISKKCTTVTILPPPLLVHHPNILD